MDKSTINIEIIKLKPIIKQATICVTNKLVKQLRKINKDPILLLLVNSTIKETGKTSDDDNASAGILNEQTEINNTTAAAIQQPSNFIKNEKLKRKIENITEKIQYLKSINKLKLAKTILTYTDDPKKIYSNPLSKPCDSATAMVYEFKGIQQKLQEIKRKFNLIPVKDEEDDDSKITNSIKENSNSSKTISSTNGSIKNDKTKVSSSSSLSSSASIDDIEKHQQWLRLIKTNGRKKEIKLKIEQHKKFIEFKKKEKLERKALNKSRSEWLIENLPSSSSNNDDTINTTSIITDDNDKEQEEEQQNQTITNQKNENQKKKEQTKRKSSIDTAKKVVMKKPKSNVKENAKENHNGNHNDKHQEDNDKKLLPKITSIQENQIVEDTFFIKQNKSYLLHITKNKQLNNPSGKLPGTKKVLNERESLSTKAGGKFSNNNNKRSSFKNTLNDRKNSNWKNNPSMINSKNNNSNNNNTVHSKMMIPNTTNNSKPKTTVTVVEKIIEENLHPSWIAAKLKKQQGIQSFQGTKITFDD